MTKIELLYSAPFQLQSYFRRYFTKAMITRTKTTRISNHQTPIPNIIPSPIISVFLLIMPIV